MHTNEIIIKNTNNILNKIQLVNQLEIQKNKNEDKKGRWITEIDKNNILIIEGINKPLNSIISNEKIELIGKKNEENENQCKINLRNKQKKEVDTNNEKSNIKMTINNKDNCIYNYEKVKMDEKNVENKACDGCFIF